MKLRASIANNIVIHLDVDDFSRDDFSVKFGNDDSNLAEIVFMAKPEYWFVICEEHVGLSGIGSAINSIGRKIEKKITTKASPGEYKSSQSKTHDSIDTCYREVSDWVRRIREELNAAKYVTADDTREIIEEIFKNVDENVESSGSYFSDHEILSLQEKLVELQSKIKDLEARYKITEESSKSIHSAIEASKKNLPNYPRGVWYKTSATKIVKAFKSFLSVQEVRAFLLDAAKKLLLGS